jgi:hypothetical protein
LPAVTLGARDERDRIPRSHAPDDTPDKLDRAALAATLELALGLVDALDEELG